MKVESESRKWKWKVEVESDSGKWKWKVKVESESGKWKWGKWKWKVNVESESESESGKWKWKVKVESESGNKSKRKNLSERSLPAEETQWPAQSHKASLCSPRGASPSPPASGGDNDESDLGEEEEKIFHYVEAKVIIPIF